MQTAGSNTLRFAPTDDTRREPQGSGPYDWHLKRVRYVLTNRQRLAYPRIAIGIHDGDVTGGVDMCDPVLRRVG